MTPHRRQRRRWRRPPQQMWPGETQRSWARQDPRPGWAGGVDRFEMCARSIESVEYVVSCASVRDESDLINYHSRTHDRTPSSHRGSTSPHVRAFHKLECPHNTLKYMFSASARAECPCVPTRRTRPYNPTSQSRMPSASPPLPSPFLPYHMPFHYSDPLGAPFRERRGVIRIRLRVLEHALVLPVVIKVAHVERVVDPRYVRRRDLLSLEA